MCIPCPSGVSFPGAGSCVNWYDKISLGWYANKGSNSFELRDKTIYYYLDQKITHILVLVRSDGSLVPFKDWGLYHDAFYQNSVFGSWKYAFSLDDLLPLFQPVFNNTNGVFMTNSQIDNATEIYGNFINIEKQPLLSAAKKGGGFPAPDKYDYNSAKFRNPYLYYDVDRVQLIEVIYG
jgi:hypothetical protein